MYIEIFLLDNAIMNMLILRSACAILRVRGNMLLQGALAVLLGIYAAFSYLFPNPLSNWYLKLPLLLVMSLGIPFKSFFRYFKGVLAVLLSTVVLGGLSYALVFFLGGASENGALFVGIPFRVVIYTAFLGMFLPRIIRGLLKSRAIGEEKAELIIEADNKKYNFSAIIDSGSSLAEPISGFPAVIVENSELKAFATIPIPISTVSESSVLYGFFPQKTTVNGVTIKLFIAISERKIDGGEAIIPLFALPNEILRRNDECKISLENYSKFYTEERKLNRVSIIWVSGRLFHHRFQGKTSFSFLKGLKRIRRR
ncbi:MAG: sigma-E processing peptidase SpoIIGA [Clostridia bacterium]